MFSQEQQNLYLKEAIKLRRELHQIPEEGFAVEKTKTYILKYLKDLGLSPEVVYDAAVVVYIKGLDDENPIGFRSDMDALCIEEENNVEYLSKHPGMMHACGHDGHMTMNLLLAKYLVENRPKIKRSVLLIFQPGEEGPGGAKPLVEAGIFEKYPIKAIFGYHLFPFFEEGVLATKPGPMMAMNSEFFITISGKSGHGAEPQRTKDAIIAGAELVTALQTIVSRNIDPRKSAVVSIGMISGGTRVNVIADEVKTCGTIRSFNEKTHALIHKRITEIVKGCELTSGCQIDLEFVEMYPEVNNNKKLYCIYKELNQNEKLVQIEKLMLSEDFSFYQKEVPGLFIGLGTGNDQKGFNENLHTARFNFDEKVLLTGLKSSIRLVNYEKTY